MSEFTPLAHILSPLIAGTFVPFYASRWIHIRSDAVTTGIVRSVPRFIEERWMKLFHDWLPMAFGISMVDLILAWAFWRSQKV